MTKRPCFQVSHLGVSYGSRPALADVNLEIRRGELLAVVGPSGCGKSTFLGCLNRLIDLTPRARVTGSVRFDRAEVLTPECDLVQLRRRVGMIFQQPNPFPLSIRRNLTYPLAEHGVSDPGRREERVRSALQRVGLLEEVSDRLDEPALELSGGQQQRLCIARALALQPEVLLLDEPCSALDPLSTAVIEDLLLSLKGDLTLVVVTHNLAQARRLADRVALFWSRNGIGTNVEVGSREQLFERPRTSTAARYVRGEVG